jgi:outer membrane receptor protein involved in Fe transport
VLIPVKTSISAAVFFALYSAPNVTNAQEQSTAAGQNVEEPKLEEVIVTASRREQTLESVPFSLSVLSGDQLTRTGVTDIQSLTAQVPGLSMFNFGTRDVSVVFPIIRGINASPAGAYLRTSEQAPVGTYINNSPIEGYFQLDDIQRVEVLRGPQGTLYGAGALGGAIRIIPNAPELNKFAGNIEIGGGKLDHSGDPSYTATGMLNVPIGDTLAFRASGRYDHQPGWINVYGILERPGSALSGIPVLANPADPVNSPGVFHGKNDWNNQNTLTARASLMWKPTDKMSAELAFIHGKVYGEGGPDINTVFPGGPYPSDPRISFPPGGNNQFFSSTEQPWSRKTQLTSLDLSYDAGFATVSATSSYYFTDGESESSGYGILALPQFAGYYAGNPINPRVVFPSTSVDTAHRFTQEVRLVSNTNPKKLFDYVVGVFYSDETSDGAYNASNPGTPEYSVAQGCTAPYYFGASFPNCLVVAGPGDVIFTQTDSQKFRDISEFGELTWHFTQHGQITFGGRHFSQRFTDVQLYEDPPFAISIANAPTTLEASKNVYKLDSSYEYASGHYVYALWSQGFRRGGTNEVPRNPPSFYGEIGNSLLTYAPDSTNNYEAGLKGRFGNGVSYTFAGFDIYWDNPQVGGRTPIGNAAVWNAKKARSTGVEFDLNIPAALPGLTLTLGGAYANARFTEDYSFPNIDVGGSIYGNAGDQLPGSAKTSAAATVTYERSLMSDYILTISANDTYRSAVYLSNFPLLGEGHGESIPGMNLVNLSASVSRAAWRLGVYVTNVLDKQAIQSPGATSSSTPGVDNDYVLLGSDTIINQPREVALRLRYSF